MFSEATRTITRLQNDFYSINTRVSECEHNIYRINNDMYDSQPLWENIRNNGYLLEDLSATVIQLSADVEKATSALKDLMSRMQVLETSIRASAVEESENQKQKIDLEISEQNIDDRENLFLKDYWYWNGEHK